MHASGQIRDSQVIIVQVDYTEKTRPRPPSQTQKCFFFVCFKKKTHIHPPPRRHELSTCTDGSTSCHLCYGPPQMINHIMERYMCGGDKWRKCTNGEKAQSKQILSWDVHSSQLCTGEVGVPFPSNLQTGTNTAIQAGGGRPLHWQKLHAGWQHREDHKQSEAFHPKLEPVNWHFCKQKQL